MSLTSTVKSIYPCTRTMFMSRKKRCNGDASRKAFAPAANIN